MSRYWQSYWYQTMCNEDRNPGWKPLHSGPLYRVPNKALVTGTLADWVVPVLEDATDEIDWITGQIRIDCCTEPAPAPGTPPFLSRKRATCRASATTFHLPRTTGEWPRRGCPHRAARLGCSQGTHVAYDSTSRSFAIISHPITIELFRGLAELEDTGRGQLPHRLPRAARAQCDDPQLLSAEAQPSGVRVVMRTAATMIELDLLRTRVVLMGVPPRPDGTVDLMVDGRRVQQATVYGGDLVRIDPATGASEMEQGEVATIRFDGLAPQDKTLEIWLPHYERTELVSLRTDAPIAAAPIARPIWVHQGSSISQGSNAATPSTTWPALAATEANLDLVNLGLSGSAMLDPFVARAIRDRPADLISVKIGINLVNSDLMRQRAFGPAVHGFLDTIRNGHPTTPIVVIGPLHCPIHESTPGPGSFDAEALAAGTLRFIALGDPADALVPNAGLRRLTLSGIREQLTQIVARRQTDDPHLSYVDGLDLYGPGDDATHPLPDNLHPDAATHRLIAQRFVALALGG